MTRIADHLIRNRYYLVDLDGQPTRWGRWGLDYFETEEGKEEQALRAVELLSHMSGRRPRHRRARFLREYRRLIDEHRFHERMQTYLSNRLELNYSDEELAMLSFDPLFRYERDETLRGYYRRAMDQWWRNIQGEDNPLWIYIYAQANPGVAAPLDRAAHTLVRMPLDLVTWSAHNGQRLDVPRAPDSDRHGRPQTTRLLPPDERHVQKWNSNPFELDGGQRRAWRRRRGGLPAAVLAWSLLRVHHRLARDVQIRQSQRHNATETHRHVLVSKKTPCVLVSS